MVTKEDIVFRQLITLSDGGRVLLRPLTAEDREQLIELFQQVSPEDLRYMRHNVTDANLIASWIENLDYDRVLPLVAVINERLVGSATLHFFEGPARHRAEVRIYLAKEVRRRGVGSRMIQALIDMSKRRNIYMIEAQIINEQATVIRAFQNLGFVRKCILDNYFILPDGELRDVAHLILRLRDSSEEF
jgi:RimJ/RimL family protein N-acetyltransferase